MWEYKNTRKKKIPDRSDQQKEVNRAKRATLYRKYRDDESFFTKTHSTINEMTISTRTTKNSLQLM